MSFDDVKSDLVCVMSEVLEVEEIFEQVLKENRDLREQVSNCKVEIGRLEALLADKKPESACECDYNSECCKDKEETKEKPCYKCSCPECTGCKYAEYCEEPEPTLKDLYELGRYLVDTVDEIESIHIQVVRTRKKEDDDE